LREVLLTAYAVNVFAWWRATLGLKLSNTGAWIRTGKQSLELSSGRAWNRAGEVSLEMSSGRAWNRAGK